MLPSLFIFSFIILIFSFLIIFRSPQTKTNSEEDLVDYSLMMSNLEEGVMFVDNDSKCIEVNQRWEEITGYTEDELLGRDVRAMLLYPEDIKFMAKQTQEREKGQSNRYEIRIKSKSEGDKWVFTIGTPLLNRQGKVIGSLGIMTDRTETIKKDKQLLAYSKKLEVSMAKLESMNNELEQFAYIVSHDLRSPINTISSFSNLLQRRHQKELSTDAQEYIEFIRTNCITMRNIVNGLLHHAKFGTNNMHKEMVSLHEIINDATMNLQGLIKENNAVINCPDLPNINCDRIQILQLFQNLIENSIKYKKDNEIPKIDIWFEENNNGIIIFIKDNGIGISPDYQGQVFQLFNQINPNHQGLGLGLGTCKKVVDNHQGKIGFESKEGEGCTFRIFLPSHSNLV
ncbi:MAG: PAS domain S-box-containing protein [Maribacter sp.]|jgi:PAS domain S-box-containing protein